jgi:hypothetical protein
MQRDIPIGKSCGGHIGPLSILFSLLRIGTTSSLPKRILIEQEFVTLLELRPLMVISDDSSRCFAASFVRSRVFPLRSSHSSP